MTVGRQQPAGDGRRQRADVAVDGAQAVQRRRGLAIDGLPQLRLGDRIVISRPIGKIGDSSVIHRDAFVTARQRDAVPPRQRDAFGIARQRDAAPSRQRDAFGTARQRDAAPSHQHHAFGGARQHDAAATQRDASLAGQTDARRAINRYLAFPQHIFVILVFLIRLHLPYRYKCGTVALLWRIRPPFVLPEIEATSAAFHSERHRLTLVASPHERFARLPPGPIGMFALLCAIHDRRRPGGFDTSVTKKYRHGYFAQAEPDLPRRIDRRKRGATSASLEHIDFRHRHP